MKGRWHDNRHTLVTELAESSAGDEVITSLAGHLSRAMPSHHSRVRMEAKRRALESLEVDEICRGKLVKAGGNGYTRRSFDILSAFMDVLGKPVRQVPDN
ncbi:MAG: hypothetical protein NTW28_16040 [Candidatus Solibacter sp.]|nr:hypothetical protein [Candidatus Solibacter sp.]